jgi:hypothetical protein
MTVAIPVTTIPASSKVSARRVIGETAALEMEVSLLLLVAKA